MERKKIFGIVGVVLVALVLGGLLLWPMIRGKSANLNAAKTPLNPAMSAKTEIINSATPAKVDRKTPVLVTIGLIVVSSLFVYRKQKKMSPINPGTVSSVTPPNTVTKTEVTAWPGVVVTALVLGFAGWWVYSAYRSPLVTNSTNTPSPTPNQAGAGTLGHAEIVLENDDWSKPISVPDGTLHTLVTGEVEVDPPSHRRYLTVPGRRNERPAEPVGEWRFRRTGDKPVTVAMSWE